MMRWVEIEVGVVGLGSSRPNSKPKPRKWEPPSLGDLNVLWSVHHRIVLLLYEYLLLIL